MTNNLKTVKTVKTEKELAEEYYYKHLNNVSKELKYVFNTEEERIEFKNIFKKFLESCPDYDYETLNKIHDLHLKLKEAVEEYKCDKRYKEIILGFIDQAIYDKNSIVVLKNYLNCYKEENDKLKKELEYRRQLLTEPIKDLSLNKYKKYCDEYSIKNTEDFLKKLNTKDLRLIDAFGLKPSNF